ncbi:magnesium and cobalt transport protein CorA [Mycobacterium sp. DL592]|uniref:magnesium and cobalt transport protein CorA n=1 Tax=Mycobacterium sp. DL592 TaxID=2675524 RepID=UPI00141D7ED0|nr:magnesium and cobalt transport protein CorA [Mycobacterium sp. DL592]
MPDVVRRPALIPQAEPVVDCGVYVDGQRLPEVFSPRMARDRVNTVGAGFVWLGLLEPGREQMEAVADVFALHPSVVDDAVRAFERPKLERHGDTLILVLKTVHYIPHETAAVGQIVETGEIMICVARDFLITSRHGDFSGLADLRTELQANPALLAHGPYYVMQAIMRNVFESYRAVATLIETDIDAMQEAIFRPGAAINVEDIYLLKREMIELRRGIGPLSEVLDRLVTAHRDLVPGGLWYHLRDLITLESESARRLNSFDNIVGDLLESALGRIALQQNDDMRKISAWGALGLVVTGVTGIYGMRFDHPELHWAWGYAGVLIAMAGICAFLYMGFRRNRWL